MKSFKLNTQIIIIFWAVIAFGASTLQKRIGSDGREYLIEDDYEYTWFRAWHECARRNRQLLTIDSAEKQEIINEVLNGTSGPLWLGANDEFKPSANADRPFFWSATGKQFTYTNWYVKNPDGNDGNRHCVLMWLVNNKWINYKCDDKNGFICEEKQLLESSNKNPNNASDVLQKFINDFDLKFRSLLKDNMAELNGQLENIRQVGKDTSNEVEKLTNITETAVQKILNEQEICRKELNHEITKQGSDLSDQLKRTADELNAKFSETQNFTYPSKNIVLIKNTGL